MTIRFLRLSEFSRVTLARWVFSLLIIGLASCALPQRIGHSGGDLTSRAGTELTELRSGRTYDMKMSLKRDAAGAGEAILTLTPKPNQKINQEYPTKLVLQGEGGAAVPKGSYGKGDARSFTPQQVVFAGRFSGLTGASARLTVSLTFVTCEVRDGQEVSCTTPLTESFAIRPGD